MCVIKKLKMVFLPFVTIIVFSLPMQIWAATKETVSETKIETVRMPSMSDQNPAYIDETIVPDAPKHYKKKKIVKKTPKHMKKKAKK